MIGPQVTVRIDHEPSEGAERKPFEIEHEVGDVSQLKGVTSEKYIVSIEINGPDTVYLSSWWDLPHKDKQNGDSTDHIFPHGPGKFHSQPQAFKHQEGFIIVDVHAGGPKELSFIFHYKVAESGT